MELSLEVILYELNVAPNVVVCYWLSLAKARSMSACPSSSCGWAFDSILIISGQIFSNNIKIFRYIE